MKKKTSFITLFIALLIISLGLFGIKNITFDNYEWFKKHNPTKINYDFLRRHFSEGEDLIVAVKLEEDFFTDKLISELKELTAQIRKVPNIIDIKNPIELTTILDQQETLRIETYSDSLAKNYLTIAEMKKRLLASKYFGSIISKDLKTISLIITIDSAEGKINFPIRRQVIKDIKEILSHSSNFYNYKLVGDTFLYFKMDGATKQNLIILLPLAFIIIALVLFIMFKSLLKIFVILTCITFCLFSTFSIIGYLNHPLTVVNIALPILILVIAISDSIHIIKRWDFIRLQQIFSKKQILKQTVKEMYIPCFLTSFTTAIGFGSFYFSDLIPLHNLGLESFISILVAYLIIMTTTPLGLYFFSEKISRSSNQEKEEIISTHNIFFSIATIVENNWKKIIYACIALLILSIYAFKFIYTETNFLDVFFKKQSTIYQDFNYVDRKCGGTGSVDIIIKQKPGSFQKIDNLKTIQTITNALQNETEINYIYSILIPINMLHTKLAQDKSTYPKTDDALEQELLFFELSRNDKKKDVLHPYVNFDYANARIHLQTNNLNTIKTEKLLTKIKQKIEHFNLPNIFTGTLVLFYEMNYYVLKTQVTSILITLIIIWIIIMFFFGFKYGTLAMLPNIFPVIIVIGTIAALHIPFDFATILIASIGLGLSIDDTVHFIHYYKEQKKKNIPYPQNIRQTMAIVGHPMLFTSILLMIGAGLFIFSDLVILRRFGIFTTYTIAMAFIIDIALTPALLHLEQKIFYRLKK